MFVNAEKADKVTPFLLFFLFLLILRFCGAGGEVFMKIFALHNGACRYTGICVRNLHI